MGARPGSSGFLTKPDQDEFDQVKKRWFTVDCQTFTNWLFQKFQLENKLEKNLLIDKIIELDIFGEDALDIKVENVDMIKLKQMDHELKVKHLQMHLREKKTNEKCKKKKEHEDMELRKAEFNVQKSSDYNILKKGVLRLMSW